MVELPSDTLYDILSRMPLKSLALFLCVCKLWCNYIDDAQIMAKEELTPIMFRRFKGLMVGGSTLKKDMIFEFPRKRASSRTSTGVFLGSCNGFVLSTKDQSDPNATFIVIHTLRKECYELPSIKIWLDIPDIRIGHSCGLGFDDSNNTFKIVCVVERRGRLCTMVQVLGTKSWQKIRQAPSCPIIGEGVFASECLHWLTIYYPQTMDERNVICFDVKKEKFTLIDPPKRTRKDWIIYDQRLVDLHGEVGIMYNVTTFNKPGRIEVWVLKQKEWVMHCEFDHKWPIHDKCLEVIGCWNKDGDILIRVNIEGCRLFVYILENGVLHEVYVIGEKVQDDADIRIYRSDLLSLKKTIWRKVGGF